MNRGDGEEGVDGYYTITHEEAKDMIKMADVDNNGTVDFEEIWKFTTKKMVGEHAEVLFSQCTFLLMPESFLCR